MLVSSNSVIWDDSYSSLLHLFQENWEGLGSLMYSVKEHERLGEELFLQSFVAYIRSIYLMANKDVFDVRSIDCKALAEFVSFPLLSHDFIKLIFTVHI